MSGSAKKDKQESPAQEKKEKPPAYVFVGRSHEESKMIRMKCDDDDSRFLEANQSILAKHSKYFEGSVSFADKEVTFDSNTVSYEALGTLIKFMDSGKLNPTTVDVEQLVVAADYLQIDAAMILLLEYLYNLLGGTLASMDNLPKDILLVCLRLYSIVRQFEIKHKYQHKKYTIPEDRKTTSTPKSVCIEFVLAHHLGRLLNEVPLLHLDEERLYEILISDDLRISEVDVLRVVKVWVNYEYASRQKHFMDLIRCVRPDVNMTTQYIVEELTCACKQEVACTCLTAPSFVIALLAERLQYKYQPDSGPLKWSVRPRISSNMLGNHGLSAEVARLSKTFNSTTLGKSPF